MDGLDDQHCPIAILDIGGSRGVVLFTASTRSRQEIEDLAAEARRLRPDVERCGVSL